MSKKNTQLFDRMIVPKTIYAKKPSANFTKDALIDIIKLDAATHCRNNPDLEFKAVGEPVKNADRSITYPILFQLKMQ